MIAKRDCKTAKEIRWWVYWHSHRNANDGRRDSAIGVNLSAWHKLGKNRYFTACGISVGPFEHEAQTYDSSRKVCKKCLKYEENPKA